MGVDEGYKAGQVGEKGRHLNISEVFAVPLGGEGAGYQGGG